MSRSGSQKVLLVLSILSIISGTLALLLSIVGFAGSGFVGGLGASDVASLTAETGLSQGEATGMLLAVGLFGLFLAALSIIEGVLGLRASKDARKIGPVRFITIVSIVLGIAGIALDLTTGGKQFSEMSSDFISLACDFFMLWICNNIKRQAHL